MELCGGMRGVFQPVVRRSAVAATAVLLTWSIAHLMVTPATAQSGPVVFDRNLSVRTVVAQLEQPVSIAFLGPDNFLLTEKASGRVKHVVNGAVSATLPLDLAVNNNSERGLLGIALHPDFASTHWVYLYWTCRTAAAPTPDTPQLDCPPVPCFSVSMAFMGPQRRRSPSTPGTSSQRLLSDVGCGRCSRLRSPYA